jgi:hypothetical protein
MDLPTLGAILGSTSRSTNQITKALNQSCELEADYSQGWTDCLRGGDGPSEKSARTSSGSPRKTDRPMVHLELSNTRQTPCNKNPKPKRIEPRARKNKRHSMNWAPHGRPAVTSWMVCQVRIRTKYNLEGRREKSKTQSNDFQKSWNFNHGSTMIQRSFSHKISKRSTLHHLKNDLG